jgi:hypothetical protein
VVALEVQADGDVVRGVVAQLAAADDDATAVALPLLLVCALAVAASTTSALVSAALCTIRYDLAPAPAARRGALGAGAGFVLAVLAAFAVAAGMLEIGFAGNAFLAWVFGFACLQLALAPLVLGPIVGAGTVRPGWALAILAAGAASGVAAVIVYFLTGVEAWLWAAVPGCLGTGLLLYAVARAAARGA